MIPRSNVAVTAILVACLGAACVAPPMPASDSNPYGNSPVDNNGGGKGGDTGLVGERFVVEASPLLDGAAMCLDVQSRYASNFVRSAMISGPCDKSGSEEIAFNKRGQMVHLVSSLCIVDSGVATLAPCSESNTTTWRIDMKGRIVASTGRCLTMEPRFGGLATVEPCNDESTQRLRRITSNPSVR